LKDIGQFIRGRRFTKNDYVDNGLGCIHYGQIYTTFDTKTHTVVTHVPESLRSSLRLATPGDVVVAATGENVAEVGKAVAWLGDDDVAVHDDCYIFQHNLNPTYAAYLFQTEDFNRQKIKVVSSSKVVRISSNNLENIKIPVPTREEQDRIVGILDNFDALINDLSSGLPAEIAARRQQYEHYRDRLLTFPERVA
jgi:type I restriction enzyme S subunit